MAVNPVPPMQPMPPKTKEIWVVLYRFHQKYMHPNRSEEFWKAAAEELGALARQFDNDPFAIDMLMAIYTDIERILKGERTP